MAFKDTRKTPEVVTHRIRITLTSHNRKSLEKVWADLSSGAKRKGISKEKRPVWMFTKTLRITQEKLPVAGS
uniref:Small ribosomal subunit protein uS10 domain-containing protein n=1 Tax=Neovison vison TaxID=452646 RepID=A0A8C7ESQ0_NEOVI